MLRGLPVADPHPRAAVCELHVWTDPSRSWVVSSMIVRSVVPDERIRVGSVGLSETSFMYCAADGLAEQIESSAPKTTKRNVSFMGPPYLFGPNRTGRPGGAQVSGVSLIPVGCATPSSIAGRE